MHSYDLTQLGPSAFENLVNHLAMKVLGPGLNGFGPGADGGRDGYFKGEAPYPSSVDRWRGVWYIQSKFHQPHLSKDPQKWLIEQVTKEVKSYIDEDGDREWPDNWIVATNIDPSGKPETGSYDQIVKIVTEAQPGRKINIAIWGGRKILDLLSENGEIAQYYGHFLTPGNVLTRLYQSLDEDKASLKEVLRFLAVTQLSDHRFTKLDQAGSSGDVRPGVHDLFIDLPYSIQGSPSFGGLLGDLCASAQQSHKYSLRAACPSTWNAWIKSPKRARCILIKGGPGQGKSTLGQYICQIQRAKLIKEEFEASVHESVRAAANAVYEAAGAAGFLPTTPRIPVQLELKEYAHWRSSLAPNESQDILSYLASFLAKRMGSKVLLKTLKKALGAEAWLFVFDGLDEVPNDSKDAVAGEILRFLNDVVIEIDADIFAICTSRPQGYSGQFLGLDGPVVELSQLAPEAALLCAKPVLSFGRTAEEAEQAIRTLEAAIKSQSIQELMTTPLQSHIMAVVVRDGGRPPERRWQLFNSFYSVMKKRESLKNFRDPRVDRLLREEDRLLKSVHMRLGFVLHFRAERSEGAQTSLDKSDFKLLVQDVVRELDGHESEGTVSAVLEATTERLVLVNTPENGDYVRFDIRQLQEFFAAEYIYTGVGPEELGRRLEVIGGDAHWREVVHFLISALIENQKTAEVAIVVQALRRLNEGTDFEVALFARRSARGAHVVSRLLNEGVLEQDNRDRILLRPLLESICGTLQLSELQSLARIQHARSKQWLIGLLLEKVRTLGASECAGAYVLLARLLPRQHAERSWLVQKFSELPATWKSEIVNNIDPSDEYYALRRRNAEFDLSDWVVLACLEALNSDSDFELAKKASAVALRICKFGLHLVESDVVGKWGKAHYAALEACLSLPLYFDGDGFEGQGEDFGFIRRVELRHNWRVGTVPDSFEGIDFANAAGRSGGVVQVALMCCELACKREDEALKSVVELIERDAAKVLSRIPTGILGLIPVPDQWSSDPFSSAFLRMHVESGFEKCIAAAQEQRLLPSCSSLSIVGASVDQRRDDPVLWRSFTEAMPALAVEFALGGGFFELPEDLPLPAPVAKLLGKRPELAMARFMSWGRLVEGNADLLSNLRGFAQKCGSGSAVRGMRTDRVRPFKLSLPSEMALLPLLVQGLTSTTAHFGRIELRSRKSLQETMLGGFGVDVEKLKIVANDPRIPNSIRAAAVALEWLSEPASSLNEKSKLDIDNIKSRYLELVSPENEDWLTAALIDGILLNVGEGAPGAAELASNLLVRCEAGSGPRFALAKLLSIWSEESLAPVTSRQVSAAWLGHAAVAPSYCH